MITSNLNLQDDFQICYLNFNEKTIPVSGNNSNILISNKFYYYKINLNGYYIYYAINPKNGEIKKLSNEFWK